MNKNNFDILNSAISTNYLNKTEDIIAWIQERNRNVHVDVSQIEFSKLNNWNINKLTGNIEHGSGKFFTIEGVNIEIIQEDHKTWSQPIINQPEIGYLGFLTKEFNGVLHFLIQAKIEPGNVNKVQLSPTIQATRSNFTKVHKGKEPAYLNYFKERKGEVIIDQLQSEQGARFYRKRNRNIILKIDEDIEVFEDFMWVTLSQIKELLTYDNLVNMDTRTVISGLNYGSFNSDICSLINIVTQDKNDFNRKVFLSILNNEKSLFTLNQIHSWLTELKSNYDLKVSLIPLNDVKDWIISNNSIYHKENKYFEVIAVDVKIENREVANWAQPIIKPINEGIVAFICMEFDGVLHFLVQAKLEIGNLDIVELAPTVQCITGNFRKGENEYEVKYLDLVLNAKEENIMHDVMLSEEGGRFFENQNRNMIIKLDDNTIIEEHINYKWMTLNQLLKFMEYNNNVNIEARSLLSVLSIK